MAPANYDDVLDQLRAGGLLVEHLEVGRLVRCRVEGSRERRGWYTLHELTTESGDVLIVGSYGVWRGNDHHPQKIELRKRELSPDQRDALKRRLAEDRRRAEQARAREAERAAAMAAKAWSRLLPDGDSDYLTRKGVQGFGLRYTRNGSAVVPLLDTAGAIHGLQFLRTREQAREGRRPEKEFWPAGLTKRGHFHLIGSPSWIVLVAEGYATAATLHMATGYPVAVAFDAGNLAPVAEALRKRYPRVRILVCADDDILGKCKHAECRARVVLTLHPEQCPKCGKAHGYTNAGVSGASTAALATGGAWVAPRFADPEARAAAWLDKGQKDTDFNDLHAGEGLHVVRVQVEARLTELRWDRPPVERAADSTSGGGAARLEPISSLDEMLDRFVMVYAHGSTAFDRREHLLMSLGDVRDACTHRNLYRAWMESPRRQIVRIEEVGFDPTGTDPAITCNLFKGWPTTPKAGSCDRLLELLRYMCSADRDPDELYRWLLRWIAYPIQHPGAKMKTTVVVHGPQGTGKNLFFEAVQRIYGPYGDVLDQSAVEDKFNDCFSRKLFLIADEVVARSDLYHIKNKLKALITGDRIRINPKNISAYWERNHVNLVFLSNEAMPVVLEEDDRRHCVIWTPDKRDAAFYRAVLEELNDGGVAALHHYLLHLDLGDFGPGTPPPITNAKAELISLGLDSPLRFYDELIDGDIQGLDPMPGLATDWYAAYRKWCADNGVRPAPQPKFCNSLVRKRGVHNPRKAYRPATNKLGPHGWLMIALEDHRCPEGEGEMDWLGKLYGRCREQIEKFKGVVR